MSNNKNLQQAGNDKNGSYRYQAKTVAARHAPTHYTREVTILDELVKQNGFALLDGATGTELFKLGLSFGASPELWNAQEPEKIRLTYQAYVDAGAQLFLTNTFGGTHYRLALNKLQDRVIELNRKAAELGRQVADAAMAATPGRLVVVAGSMGPTGELLEPEGAMSMRAYEAAFAEQAEGLAAGGADVLWIETMSSTDEVRAAVAGVRAVCDLPVCVTLSFDTARRTMTGVDGAAAAQLSRELDLDAIGANCGNNLADTEAAVSEIIAAGTNSLIILKANAGLPERRGTDLHYSGTPEIMGACAHRAKKLGVQLIGACCGSTPEHLALMRQVLDGEIGVPEVEHVTAVTKVVERDPENKTRRRRRI